MSGGLGGVERRARRHRARRARAGLSPIKINAVVQRGVNDHTVLDLRRALPRHAASSCASSNTWTSATATTGSRDAWCRRRSCCARIARALAARAAASATIAAKSRERYAFADGARRDRLHLVGQRSRSAATARARGCRRTARSTLPVRDARHDLRGPLRAGASDAELARAAARRLGARDDRYSELRAGARARQRRRAGRDVPHRRLMGRNAHARRRRTDRPTMVDVGAKPSRTRDGDGARRACAFRADGRARCARADMRTKKGPVVRHGDHRRHDGREAHARADSVLPSARDRAVLVRDRIRRRRRARRSVHGRASRTRPASRWKR